MRNYFLALFILLFSNCKRQSDSENSLTNSNEIISELINNLDRDFKELCLNPKGLNKYDQFDSLNTISNKILLEVNENNMNGVKSYFEWLKHETNQYSMNISKNNLDYINEIVNEEKYNTFSKEELIHTILLYEYLLGKVYFSYYKKSFFTFSAIKPINIANNDVIKLGDDYNIEIGILGYKIFDDSLKLIINDDTIFNDRSELMYSINKNKLGKNTIKGKVQFMHYNKLVSYPIEFSYICTE